MDDADATIALHRLCKYLSEYYGKKVIAFKTNPWLARGMMTGITRVSKESIFSDLNNLEVVTTTSDKYTAAFGFTEEEVFCALDEQIVYDELDGSEQAVWSLLLASGYLRVAGVTEYAHDGSAEPVYELELTNQEVRYMFQRMIRSWFHMTGSDYNDFVKALLLGDVDAMNEYMNRVARDTFSFFDTKSKVSARTEPGRFYHGFVLGLIVELQGKYVITSNRESGFGRYDIMLDPVSAWDDAMIIEFKVRNPRREKSIEETLENALLQIEEKDYAAAFLAKGIPLERIRRYGFAFEGKNVLIG